VSPAEKLVLGVTFAIFALIGLIVLEICYLVVLHAWSSEIFAAISALVGTIIGTFFGARA
jgi:multisubunit Na+/H+ antiporter MnhG subunit